MRWDSRNLFVGVVLFLLLFLSTSRTLAEDAVVIGKIPGEYVEKTPSRSYLGYVVVEGGLITEIDTVDQDGIDALKEKFKDKTFTVKDEFKLSKKNDVSIEDRLKYLKERYVGTDATFDENHGSKETTVKITRTVTVPVIEAKSGRKYDVLYPALIDLHGHNKQNMLPTWGNAVGQFSNRFEWRKDVKNYKEVNGENMNPWSAKKEAKVSAYRWTEMQAMVLGTGYLQGAIQNHKYFAINSVEDKGAYKSDRVSVESPGDMIEPESVHFLWNELRPIILKEGCLGEDDCYGKAVKIFLDTHCEGLPAKATANIYSEESYRWLMKNADTLSEKCDVEEEEPFLTYFTDVFGVDQHSEFIKRRMTLSKPNRSAIVTHLGEGHRHDPYNWTEFQALRLGGLIMPGMSFIHGVGLRSEDFKTMADNEMGLVWSPYSNFLLYGQTVDINEAKAKGVTIAIGSDWTPTGSKGVLEELKLARNYVIKKGFSRRRFSDKELYYMVTKNAAKIINHYGYEEDGEHGIGTLQEKAMGSLIAVTDQHSNPYTNLVAHAYADHVNLVVIDGKVRYGNRSLVEQTDRKFEVISTHTFTQTLAENADAFPEFGSSSEEIGKMAVAVELGEANNENCKFAEEKVFVTPVKPTYDYPDKVVPHMIATKSEDNDGLDLDTYKGVVRYLGIALLSQSRNANKGSEWAVAQFPPLYGCQDKAYMDRLLGMVKEEGEDELDANNEARMQNRIDINLFSYQKNADEYKFMRPHRLAELYKLPYTKDEAFLEDIQKDIVVDVWLDVESEEFEGLLK